MWIWMGVFADPALVFGVEHAAGLKASSTSNHKLYLAPGSLPTTIFLEFGIRVDTMQDVAGGCILFLSFCLRKSREIFPLTKRREVFVGIQSPHVLEQLDGVLDLAEEGRESHQFSGVQANNFLLN